MKHEAPMIMGSPIVPAISAMQPTDTPRDPANTVPIPLFKPLLRVAPVHVQ